MSGPFISFAYQFLAALKRCRNSLDRKFPSAAEQHTFIQPIFANPQIHSFTHPARLLGSRNLNFGGRVICKWNDHTKSQMPLPKKCIMFSRFPLRHTRMSVDLSRMGGVGGRKEGGKKGAHFKPYLATHFTRSVALFSRLSLPRISNAYTVVSD